MQTQVVIPAIAAPLLILAAVIALEQNTSVDFGMLGDVARVVWFLVGAAALLAFLGLVLLVARRT